MSTTIPSQVPPQQKEKHPKINTKIPFFCKVSTCRIERMQHKLALVYSRHKKHFVCAVGTQHNPNTGIWTIQEHVLLSPAEVACISEAEILINVSFFEQALSLQIVSQTMESDLPNSEIQALPQNANQCGQLPLAAPYLSPSCSPLPAPCKSNAANATIKSSGAPAPTQVPVNTTAAPVSTPTPALALAPAPAPAVTAPTPAAAPEIVLTVVTFVMVITENKTS